MSKNVLRISIVLGLFVAMTSLGLRAQEEDFENFGDDEFSEVDFEESDESGDEFEDVEFDDDIADEEFEEEDFEEEEFAEEPIEPQEEEQLVEEPPVEDLVEPVAEEPVEELIEEPISEDLTPPEVATEENLFSTPASPDEPNVDYEARLHEIYKNFHKNKTSEEDWQNIAGERMTEVYTIQKNDKLWEISSTLFGDGNYWPKVWSLNSRIRNPHLITPNNKIQFVLGDESGPPAFSIAEEEPEEEGAEKQAEVKEPEPVLSAAQRGATDDINEPEIPPTLIKSRPVVKVLPPSLPKWQVLGERGEFDEFGIDYGKRKITQLKNIIPLSAYVSEEPLNSTGQVSEAEAGGIIASALQYLYVEVDSGTAQVGDTLLVVLNRGLVESAHSSVTGFLGYSIEIQGEIKIVEQVERKTEEVKKRRRKKSGRNAENSELFRAIITKMINPVSVGSVLLPGRLEYIEVNEEGPRSQVSAQIIGGQNFNKRQVYGTESIAYINRGANDGLEPGQILSVRENRSIRNSETFVKANVRPIGWAKVVKVTPNMATILVVKSWSDILTGDLTGAGPLISKLGEESDSPQLGVETASRTLLQELDGTADADSDTVEEAPSGANEFEEFEEEEFGDDEEEFEE